MSRSFNKKYFDTVLNITSWAIRITVIALFFLLVLLALTIGVVTFLPKGLLDFDLANLQNIDMQLQYAFISINPDYFTGIINVKWSIVLTALVGLTNVGFLLYIFILLKKIVTDVKTKRPFSELNVRRFNFIGISFIVAALILPIFNSLLLSNIFKLLSVDFARVTYTIDIQQVFMGLLVLVLANIFEYGKNLQEENDLTV